MTSALTTIWTRTAANPSGAATLNHASSEERRRPARRGSVARRPTARAARATYAHMTTAPTAPTPSCTTPTRPASWFPWISANSATRTASGIEDHRDGEGARPAKALEKPVRPQHANHRGCRDEEEQRSIDAGVRQDERDQRPDHEDDARGHDHGRAPPGDDPRRLGGARRDPPRPDLGGPERRDDREVRADGHRKLPGAEHLGFQASGQETTSPTPRRPTQNLASPSQPAIATMLRGPAGGSTLAARFTWVGSGAAPRDG